MAHSSKTSGVRRLTSTELAAWRAVPTAVISDECGHRGVLANIRPLLVGRSFAGQALTIETQDVDNGAPRAALAEAWPGAVIIIDARAHPTSAVWGGKLIAIARSRGIAGVVVDGNVRDTAELRVSGVPICCRGVTPRGPVWGGQFNVAIECGGVSITPGDLIVGDDDGVIAVPLGLATGEFLARCRARIKREAEQVTHAKGVAKAAKMRRGRP